MRVHAVINREAGSAIAASPDDLVAEAERILSASGWEVTAEHVCAAGMDARMDEALAAKPDVLLAGGGDGTVRAASGKLIGKNTALGILPLGTLNRLARDLGIPLTPPEALRALANGEIRRIDAAEVNGRIFLCNSLIGLPLMVSTERQKLRGASLGARIRGYASLLRRVVGARSRLALAIDDGQEEKVMRVLTLAVSNNLYAEEPSMLLKREALDRGELGVYSSRHRSGLGLLGVLARAAAGAIEGDPNVETLRARAVTISSKRETLRLSNDGEVERMTTPLRYRSLPRAIAVLAPAQAAQ